MHAGLRVLYRALDVVCEQILEIVVWARAIGRQHAHGRTLEQIASDDVEVGATWPPGRGVHPDTSSPLW
jgi:hypothetical protein